MSKRPFLVNDPANVVHIGPARESRDKRLVHLEEAIEVQKRDGNWNYSPYMMGLTNGLILAQALMHDVDPKYLDAPDIWGVDKAEKIGVAEPTQPERTP